MLRAGGSTKLSSNARPLMILVVSTRNLQLLSGLLARNRRALISLNVMPPSITSSTVSGAPPDMLLPMPCLTCLSMTWPLAASNTCGARDTHHACVGLHVKQAWDPTKSYYCCSSNSGFDGVHWASRWGRMQLCKMHKGLQGGLIQLSTSHKESAGAALLAIDTL